MNEMAQLVSHQGTTLGATTLVAWKISWEKILSLVYPEKNEGMKQKTIAWSWIS